MKSTRIECDKQYLAALAVVNDMLRGSIIDEGDYSALETKFADKFQPLFRYEKPCLSATLPITLTDERRG